QPLHLQRAGPADRRPAGARPRRRIGHLRLRRSPAAGAGADRHRDRLRHDRALPRGAAGITGPERERPCRRPRGWRMMTASDHLIIAPILLPLVAGGLMLLFDGRHRPVLVAINLVATFA